MTREEFDSTFKNAEAQYLQAMELMEQDAPFMENLPERMPPLILKIRDMIPQVLNSQTPAEVVEKLKHLAELSQQLVPLHQDVLAFLESSKTDFEQVAKLMFTYKKHCHPGSNMPHTQEGAAEWALQLEETAAGLLTVYKPLHIQITELHQRYNKLMLSVQPYLN